jgi:hypothetical protein
VSLIDQQVLFYKPGVGLTGSSAMTFNYATNDLVLVGQGTYAKGTLYFADTPGLTGAYNTYIGNPGRIAYASTGTFGGGAQSTWTSGSSVAQSAFSVSIFGNRDLAGGTAVYYNGNSGIIPAFFNFTLVNDQNLTQTIVFNSSTGVFTLSANQTTITLTNSASTVLATGAISSMYTNIQILRITTGFTIQWSSGIGIPAITVFYTGSGLSMLDGLTFNVPASANYNTVGFYNFTVYQAIATLATNLQCGGPAIFSNNVLMPGLDGPTGSNILTFDTSSGLISYNKLSGISYAGTTGAVGYYGGTNIGPTGNSGLVYTPGGTLTSTYSGTGVGHQITGTDTFGGAGYSNFLRATNTYAGATNPNKSFRLSSTGTLEILNSGYTATLLGLTDVGILNIGNTTSVTSYSANNNALNFNGGNGQIYSDGNLHIQSTAGQIWLNPLDSSSVAIGTQYNSGSGGGLLVQGNIISNTVGVTHSFFAKAQSAVSAAFGTTTSLDNLNCRINGTGGNGGILQLSAISGSFAAFTTTVSNIAGNALNGNTNSSGITFSAGSWANISGTTAGTITLASGGDMITAHVYDTTNSRIYRITAIHGPGNTNGYVGIERIG